MDGIVWDGHVDANGDPIEPPFNPFDEGTEEHRIWANPRPTPVATHWECTHGGGGHVEPALTAVREQCGTCGRGQTADDVTAVIRDTTPGDPDGEPAGGAAAKAADVRLPADFWDRRPFLSHIRAAARARRAHPDAVLGAALARIAAMVPPGLKFDSFDDGSDPDGSVNLFCCLLAPSGVGKSRAASVAAKLIVVPAPIAAGDGRPDWEKFRCDVGIGSGEGLIEAYMGTIDRETGEISKKGEPVTEKVRAQVRNHAFVYVDEGETLNKLISERRGATLGGTIRSAWGGGALGQANAAAETTRHLAAGGYALGLLVGYQFGTAAALLSDAGPGTPQRFLWFGAQDRLMTAERHPWPGSFKLPDWVPAATITFAPEIIQGLVEYDVAKNHGTVVVDELDSHEPLMWCKLAALFCLIDGRYTVNAEDWALARQVYATSAQIRTELARELARQVAAEKAARRADLAEDDQARKQAGTDVVRVARRIEKKAGEGPFNWSAWKRNAGRDKPFADRARDHAEAQGWIDVSDDGEIRPRKYAE